MSDAVGVIHELLWTGARLNLQSRSVAVRQRDL